jgi:hypothetical protein
VVRIRFHEATATTLAFEATHHFWTNQVRSSATVGAEALVFETGFVAGVLPSRLATAAALVVEADLTGVTAEADHVALHL